MLEVQTAPPEVDESKRYRDRSWRSIEDAKCTDAAGAVQGGAAPAGWVTAGPNASKASFDGLIHIGQRVFSPDNQSMGLTTKLFVDSGRHTTYLAIRTARLFGQHKMLPITCVSSVTPLRVQLSITREQFMALPDYQSDPSLAEAVDRALWNDEVLRHTDYDGMDVQVRDGVVLLHGHVMTSMNQWRAKTAIKHIPGILGVRSYLIPDDQLTLEVAGALGQMEQATGSKFFTKVDHGVVVLVGEVSSTALRDQAEQCAAEIPWVRGIMNEISVPGVVLAPEDSRFLQPLIGQELLFKDALSVRIQKVVINPHNRRVVAMLVKGRVPEALAQGQPGVEGEERSPERLVMVPVGLILHLTRSAGFLQRNSTETTQLEAYAPARYITPGKDWLPPYPYCTDDVLFLAE